MPDDNWTPEYQDGEPVPGTPYRVLSLLGAGGMGSVYIVEHVELGRVYVLKSLLRSLASREDLIARMRNEWRALGALKHPNIVDVINAGTRADGVPYYVMELLTGETVRDRLARLGKFPPDHAVRVAQATLLGLAAAHAIGVVHRDVKPANVFLTRDGSVKVLDFGIAQVYVQGAPIITEQGLAIGTPRYMSPEQASGEKADARSDVYAVGLLLYEMIAGEGPFDDLSDITQQMMAHLHRPPRPLHHFADVPPGLEEVIQRALAKLPDERPRSAEYMAAALAPFAGSASKRVEHGRASSPFAPGYAPISSPTPAGIVLSTKPPRGVRLESAWYEPTLERPSEPGRSRGSVTPDFYHQVRGSGRRGSRGWKVGIGLTAALVGGLALATFASGSADSNARPASGVTSSVEQVGTTATGSTTPTASTTATPIPILTASAGKAKPPRKPRKRPPAPRPASSDETPVRLPVSGL